MTDPDQVARAIYGVQRAMEGWQDAALGAISTCREEHQATSKPALSTIGLAVSGWQGDRDLKTFEVRRAGLLEDRGLNFRSLILAEGEDGSGARLEISRSLAYDDQDRALGQDTYSLSDESGATHYGGVTAWTLDDSNLHISLNPEASEALDADGGYQLRLILSPAEASTTRRGLDEVLSPNRA